MPSAGQKTEPLLAIAAAQPVIPVLKIARAGDAVPLARALAKGGLPAIEITLRTPAALDAIRAVAHEAPEAVVGAGTILDARRFGEAAAAGARFIVSPGFTPQLAAAAADSEVPLLPGAITPGEIMAAAEAGYSFLKFFPAEQAGGAAFLKALASPSPASASAPPAASARRMRATISHWRTSCASAARGSRRMRSSRREDGMRSPRWRGMRRR